MPPIRSGRWRPGWCSRNCAPRWRCATTRMRRRWACCTSPTTTRTRRRRSWTTWAPSCPRSPTGQAPWAWGSPRPMSSTSTSRRWPSCCASCRRDQYRVFSGVAPLAVGDGMGFEPYTALVHADATTPDVSELIAEMAARTATGYLFGGPGLQPRRRGAVRGRRQWQHQGAGRGRRRVSRRPVRRGFRRGHFAGIARDARLPAGGARSA